MTPEQAIQILAGKQAGNSDEARMTLAAAVTLESEYGDPDDSIMDWIAGGSLSGNETVESIAAEWDERDE